MLKIKYESISCDIVSDKMENMREFCFACALSTTGDLATPVTNNTDE